MKIVMSYKSHRPPRKIFLWSGDQYLEEPIEVIRTFEYDSPEAALEVFKERLTKSIKTWIYTGDYIHFNLFDMELHIKDFYGYGKYEKYSDERSAMPVFLSLEDWFEVQRIDAFSYKDFGKLGSEEERNGI